MDVSANIKNFLESYSQEDVLESLFVLDLDPENNISFLKIQILYQYLNIVNFTEKNRKIKSFDDFLVFYKEIEKVNFDLGVLEMDPPVLNSTSLFWWNQTFYRILYFGYINLVYDKLREFSLIYKSLDDSFKKVIDESPIEDLEYFLSLQNQITLALYDQNEQDSENYLKPFWQRCLKFIKTFNEGYLENKFLIELKKSDITHELVIENLSHGKFLEAFFLKGDDYVYPVMPKRWAALLIDTWGKKFKENFSEIEDKLDEDNSLQLIFNNFSNYIKDRIPSSYLFQWVKIIEDEKTLGQDDFVLINYRNSFIFLSVFPFKSVFNKNDCEYHPKISIEKIYDGSKVRFYDVIKGGIIEMSPTNSSIDPLLKFYSLVPCLNTSDESFYFKSEYIKIQQLSSILALFDEVFDLNEFIQFLEFFEENKKKLVFGDLLTTFYSFTKSDGVLTVGATEPTSIIFMPGDADQYRLSSLDSFFKVYPCSMNEFDPRTFYIANEKKISYLSMVPKADRLTYIYFYHFNNFHFFINGPTNNVLLLEEGTFNDSLMQMIPDALDEYGEFLENLFSVAHSVKVRIHFFADIGISIDEKFKYITNYKDAIPYNNLYVDSKLMQKNQLSIRIVYEYNSVRDKLLECRDRSFQIDLLHIVLTKLNQHHLINYDSGLYHFLNKEKSEPPRFVSRGIEKDYSFPQDERIYTIPSQKEIKMVYNLLAQKAYLSGLLPGEYTEKEDSLKVLNEIIQINLTLLESQLSSYSSKSMEFLISNLSTLGNEEWREYEKYKSFRNQEINYSPEEHLYDKQVEIFSWYKVNKYVLEKFLAIEDYGDLFLEEDQENFKLILAVADRLLHFYNLKDQIKYQIFPTVLTIDKDFVLETEIIEPNLSERDQSYFIDNAKLGKGEIGNSDDSIYQRINYEIVAEKINKGFFADFNFSFDELMFTLFFLKNIADLSETTEKILYKKTVEELFELISTLEKPEQLELSIEKLKIILNFLTLDVSKIMTVEDQKTHDVPVWEHRKRFNRVDLRPLVNNNGLYIWSGFMAYRSANIWGNTMTRMKAPSNIPGAKSLSVIFEELHREIEVNMELNIEEIVSRMTPFTIRGLNPSRLWDKVAQRVGEYDLIAFFESENTIFNIESKYIDAPFCIKDSNKVSEKIFKSSGKKRGYLKKVEDREEYLKENIQAFFNHLNWDQISSDSPTVISLFVTNLEFWWTRYPVSSTGVKFVQSERLEEYIENLLKNKV